MENKDTFIWLEQFLGYFQAIKERSPLTIKEYRYDLVLFFRFIVRRKQAGYSSVPFEDTPIDKIDDTFLKQISLADLYAFVTWLSVERQNGPAIRSRRISAIKSFFKYLYNKAKIINENIALELESPRLMRRLPKHLSLEESQQLLEAAASHTGNWTARDYCILTLFLNCGMRLSELCSINLSHIRGDTLTVIGKGNKERTVYLNAACLDAIDDYRAVRPTHLKKDFDALFISKQGHRISSKMVQVLIKNYLIAAGLDSSKYSTHKLRHTAATLMYKYGKVDIRALQAILGHTSIATTEIYTHIDAESLHHAVESNPLNQTRRKIKNESL